MGNVWNYEIKGVIAKIINSINASTYDNESSPKIEWKANLDSWAINTDMEIET